MVKMNALIMFIKISCCRFKSFSIWLAAADATSLITSAKCLLFIFAIAFNPIGS